MKLAVGEEMAVGMRLVDFGDELFVTSPEGDLGAFLCEKVSNSSAP